VKIYVNAIPPEGLDLEEDFTPAELDLGTNLIHYSGAVNVKVHIERDKDIVNVHCDIKGMEEQTCSKCLSPFDYKLKKSVNFIYQLKGENTIDLNDNIREEIILEYPIRMLCKADCKGLCFKCGKNLNEGPCGCGGLS
jgi:uncharacterized protein